MLVVVVALLLTRLAALVRQVRAEEAKDLTFRPTLRNKAFEAEFEDYGDCLDEMAAREKVRSRDICMHACLDAMAAREKVRASPLPCPPLHACNCTTR